MQLGQRATWEYFTFTFVSDFLRFVQDMEKRKSVCRKPQIHVLPSFGRRSLRPVIVRINVIPFIFFEADVQTFEIRITAWRNRDQNRWYSFLLSFLRFSVDWNVVFLRTRPIDNFGIRNFSLYILPLGIYFLHQVVYCRVDLNCLCSI